MKHVDGSESGNHSKGFPWTWTQGERLTLLADSWRGKCIPLYIIYKIIIGYAIYYITCNYTVI